MKAIETGIAVSFRDVAFELPSLDGPIFQIINGLNFVVQRGEFAILVGRSGCGKTTTLNIAAGFAEPTTGSVTITETNGITRPAMVFQSDTVFPWLSVRDNIAFVTRNRRSRSTSNSIDNILRSTGLARFGRFYPRELSGGMRKRVELARAWLSLAPTLLLDEPFGALDQITRAEMQLVLQDLWMRDARSILMVTHDIEEALFLADTILIMEGPPARIKTAIHVTLPRPRSQQLRYQEHFQGLRRQVLEALESADARTEHD